MKSIRNVLSSSIGQQHPASVRSLLERHYNAFGRTLTGASNISLKKVLFDDYYLLVLGDSVAWGQGLLEEDKYYSKIEQFLLQKYQGISIMKKNLAHSGATIGVGDTRTIARRVSGEVPISYPTVLQQCNEFDGIGDIVDLVIIIAGINDVNVRNILNPTVPISDILQLTERACYNQMSVLVQQTARRFPNAKIVVLGYYRIISQSTDVGLLILLLAAIAAAIGSAGGPLGSLIGGVIGTAGAIVLRDEIARRCGIFVAESNKWLSKVVNEIRAQVGNNERIFFAYPAFGESNAMFASDPWIFGINGDLSAQDDVSPSRSAACEFAGSIYPDDVSKPVCKIASIGHPNKKGSRAYSEIFTRFDAFDI